MEKVSAILLAAGLSTRMGRSKQLLPVGGKPAVVRCIASMHESGIRDIVAVTGRYGDEVRAAIKGLPVTIAFNGDPGSDMAGSVRAGLARVDPRSAGVFVLPCDHPLITPETFRAMLREFSEHPGTIIIPRYASTRGHPVLFPREILDEIRELPTLREIIGRYPEKVRLLDLSDQGTVLGMNTPRDYRKILARYETVNPGGRNAMGVTDKAGWHQGRTDPADLHNPIDSDDPAEFRGGAV